MFRLLSIEYHKLKYNTASKVLIIIYFLLLTSTALIAMINFDFAGIKFHLAEMGIFNFPYIWHLNTYLSATIKFFLLLVIVSMMANEYSNKTLKQNLIDGLSKKEFILSKFYTVLVFALVSTLLLFKTAPKQYNTRDSPRGWGRRRQGYGDRRSIFWLKIYPMVENIFLRSKKLWSKKIFG